jgi:hypothetical protein
VRPQAPVIPFRTLSLVSDCDPSDSTCDPVSVRPQAPVIYSAGPNFLIFVVPYSPLLRVVASVLDSLTEPCAGRRCLPLSKP